MKEEREEDRIIEEPRYEQLPERLLDLKVPEAEVTLVETQQVLETQAKPEEQDVYENIQEALVIGPPPTMPPMQESAPVFKEVNVEPVVAVMSQETEHSPETVVAVMSQEAKHSPEMVEVLVTQPEPGYENLTSYASRDVEETESQTGSLAGDKDSIRSKEQEPKRRGLFRKKEKDYTDSDNESIRSDKKGKKDKSSRDSKDRSKKAAAAKKHHHDSDFFTSDSESDGEGIKDKPKDKKGHSKDKKDKNKDKKEKKKETKEEKKEREQREKEAKREKERLERERKEQERKRKERKGEAGKGAQKT